MPTKINQPKSAGFEDVSADKEGAYAFVKNVGTVVLGITTLVVGTRVYERLSSTVTDDAEGVEGDNPFN